MFLLVVGELRGRLSVGDRSCDKRLLLLDISMFWSFYKSIKLLERWNAADRRIVEKLAGRHTQSAT